MIPLAPVCECVCPPPPPPPKLIISWDYLLVGLFLRFLVCVLHCWGTPGMDAAAFPFSGCAPATSHYYAEDEHRTSCTANADELNTREEMDGWMLVIRVSVFALTNVNMCLLVSTSLRVKDQSPIPIRKVRQDAQERR